MSPRALATDVLLAAGGLVLVLASVGLVVRRDVRDRIHYVSLAAVVGAPLVVLGLALSAASWRSGVKLVIIGMLLAGTGPAVSAATGRAVERSMGTGHDEEGER